MIKNQLEIPFCISRKFKAPHANGSAFEAPVHHARPSPTHEVPWADILRRIVGVSLSRAPGIVRCRPRGAASPPDTPENRAAFLPTHRRTVRGNVRSRTASARGYQAAG